MSATVYIGDEVSAAGYRLCGAETYVAGDHDVASLIERACESARLVLIGSSAVRCLDEREREVLMSRITPSVLIVPDVTAVSDEGKAAPDIAALIHKQLGMLE